MHSVIIMLHSIFNFRVDSLALHYVVPHICAVINILADHDGCNQKTQLSRNKHNKPIVRTFIFGEIWWDKNWSTSFINLNIRQCEATMYLGKEVVFYVSVFNLT